MNSDDDQSRRKNKVVADLLFQHHAVFLVSLQLTDLLSPNKVARDTGTEWDIYTYTSGVSVCVCVYVWP
ncbi:Uncharacterized protein APZ42_011112 [Daphnia magna]|uniref:Uncharacterized protein n=1 Tax=Daphnia magna TaxID=35525 RepID=A0A162T757_9CRUS|nr:Uncharacterized protein APZ42_011112 [Daphnia magna]